MINFLTILFIKNLTIEKGIELAKMNGVTFDLEEANIIVPFLKNNANLVSFEHKNELLSKIKPNVNSLTFGKIIKLLNNLNF